MVDYTTPIKTTFELQRQSLTQGQRAIEGGLAFQKEMTGAAIDTLEIQESTQRQGVELVHESIHRTLDAMEGMPGMAPMIDDVRAGVDEQYDELLTAHAEAFDTIESELGEGLDAYDEMTVEYLETLDEQLETLLEAHENFEDQSVEATEQVSEQVDDVQQQIRDVSEQAAKAIEA